MIRVMLSSASGATTLGGDALLADWRADPSCRLWLDIEGELGQAERDLLLGLGCDPLAIADCSRVRHPPKVEYFSDNTFILFRGMASLNDRLELDPQQIGIWVGDGFLITVHRGKSVSIEHCWEQDQQATRVDLPAGRVLQLIHYAGGRYLERLLNFEDKLAVLEDGMLSHHSESDMKELVLYRSRLRKLRRIFNYHQRLAQSLLEDGSPHIGQGEDALHLRRDLYDRCERVYSLSSMYYELCGDLVEGYISLSSHQLNQTMKVLTIISAIFVPLTFLAGIYGMNFNYMPELNWRYAYFVLLGLMVTVAATLYWVFRRIRWL
ncbi:MAG: magnesium transporter CorA family protein [Halioglobus sp.]|nr:magnesium transporter CorA family protein [Halioglobus sp.]